MSNEMLDAFRYQHDSWSTLVLGFEFELLENLPDADCPCAMPVAIMQPVAIALKTDALKTPVITDLSV